MLNEPAKIIFLVGFVIYTAIRHVYGKRTRNEPPTRVEIDRQEQVLLALVMLGNLLVPVVHVFTPLFSFADYWSAPGTIWVGSGLMCIAIWLFWRAHADLGRNWSVSLEIRAGHELVTNGIYGRVRHPMYAAIWLFGLAQALLFHNWVAGWSALATFAPMYFLRTPREERLLQSVFGDAYQDYVRRTGRLFPRFRTR